MKTTQRQNRTIRNRRATDNIKNAELERHRQAFLGKSGSNKWREYQTGLIATKLRIFNKDRTESIKELTRLRKLINSTTRRQTGGQDISVSNANTLLRTKLAILNDEDDVNSEINGRLRDFNNRYTSIVKDALRQEDINEFGRVRRNLDAAIKEYNDSDPKSTDDAENILDIIEEYDELLTKIEEANVIFKASAAKANNEFGKMFGVHWLIDIFDEPDMKLLLEFAEHTHSQKPLTIPTEWEQIFNTDTDDYTNAFDYDALRARINTTSPTAEDVKIEYIPFFLQVYLRLINTLNYMKTSGKKNANYKLGKQTEYDDLTSPRTIRKLILFSIRILRDMNMYVNPIFFDDLYYYYYFLQLDKLFDIDSLFRNMYPRNVVEPDEKGARVTMRVFEQASSDSNPNKIKYGVDFRQDLFNDNPTRDFDFWLNMIRVRPEWDSNEIVSQKSANLLMTPPKDDSVAPTLTVNDADAAEPTESLNTPLDNNEDDEEYDEDEYQGEDDYADEDDEGQDQTGGDLNGPEYESQLKNTYLFLDDSPLAKDFDGLSAPEFKECEVHMCVYSLDYSCKVDNQPTPFLKYVMDSPNKEHGELVWKFPSFYYSVLENSDDNNRNFQCESFTTLLDLLKISLCGSESNRELALGGANETPVAARPKAAGEIESNTRQLDDSTQSRESIKSTSTENDVDINTPELSSDISDQSIPSHPVNKCASMETAIDAVFQGMILDTLSDDKPHLFAFFNYDELMKFTKIEDNKTASDNALFCSSAKYPINDENDEIPVRWGTIDELIFEKKMFGQEVDPRIQATFKKHDIVWNITRESNEPVEFPFVVYSLKESDSGKFETVTVEQGKQYAESQGDSSLSARETDKYGNESIVDKYGARYCFTVKPFEIEENIVPKRFALFAVNPVYEVTDADVDTLQQTYQIGGDELNNRANMQPQSESLLEAESQQQQPGSLLEAESQQQQSESLPTVESQQQQSESLLEAESQQQQSESLPTVESQQQQSESLLEAESQQQQPGSLPKVESQQPQSDSLLEAESQQQQPDSLLEAESQQQQSDSLLEVESQQQQLNSTAEPVFTENPDDDNEMIPQDLNEEVDEQNTYQLTIPVVYTITNNEFTNNKPIVIWAAQKNIFCGL